MTYIELLVDITKSIAIDFAGSMDGTACRSLSQVELATFDNSNFELNTA